MNGKHHILAIATIFFAAGAIGIVSAALLFALGQHVNIVTVGSSVLYVIAAYYLLEGLKVAKYFLAVMSAISALVGGIGGVVLIGDGNASFGAFLLLLFGIVMAYCFYTLQFSSALNSEFNRRAAEYRSKKETTAQRYLQELEQEISRE